MAVATRASVRSAAWTLAASGVGWRPETISITLGRVAVESLGVPSGAVVKPDDAVEHACAAVVASAAAAMAAAALPAPTMIDPPAFGRSGEDGRQADVGMRGGDRRIVKRQQPGARAGLLAPAVHGPPFMLNFMQCLSHLAGRIWQRQG